MSNVLSNAFDLSINQVFNLIKTIGRTQTVMVQGRMGSGKSSLLKMLAAEFPEHTPVYFDCTTKDLMDLGVPKVTTHENGNEFVTFPTNEELGLHLDKPVILMFDEWGKNKSIKLATLRVMLERQLGNRKLHPDSIVFATTNLSGENVGDTLEAHARNRLMIVRMRKSTAEEWVQDYAINAGIHEVLVAWVLRETPQVFQSYEEVENPDAPEPAGNPYIFHPKAVGRMAFTTHRSIAAASPLMYAREQMDEETFRAALAGTVGVRAASDLASYVKLAEEMPTLEEIKENPKAARIPTSPAAVCMVIMRTLNTLSRDWVNAWMDYFMRMQPEEQALFVLSARHEKYKHREMVMTNKKYTEWCLKNQHLFAADKK